VHRNVRHFSYVSLSDTLCPVIKSFRHDGLQRFFSTGSKAGIQPNHAKNLSLQPLRLDGATSALDMNLPGWDWHPLKDALPGHWAVPVNGNWRLTFTFEGTDAILVDYQDYH
jgi:proteic killer suppression protein